MSGTNVEYLFENFSVSEIEEIQKKLTNEIKNKKEDVKQLVGERYRDLIDAADTIQEMRESCHQVILGIESLQQFASQSNLVPLKYKAQTQAKGTFNWKQDPTYIYAAKVKLILETPLAIWRALEVDNFLGATYFYFETRLLCDSLKGQNGATKGLNVIAEYEAAVSRFHGIITDSCWNFLWNLETVEESESAVALSCLLLLQKLTPKELLQQFLEVQENKSLESFQEQNKDVDAREALVKFFSTLFLTMRCVQSVFFDESGARSLLLRKLNDLSKVKSARDISPGSKLSTVRIKEVEEFKLRPESVVADMEPTAINNLLTTWIENLRNKAQACISDALTTVDSIGKCFSLLLAVDTFFSVDDNRSQWDEYCQSLLEQYLPLWDFFLRVPFKERLQSLISLKLTQCFQNFSTNLNNNIKTLPIDEYDVSSFVWADKGHENSDLKMKAFAISPHSLQFSSDFNQQLGLVLGDAADIMSRKDSLKLIDKGSQAELKEYFFNVCNEMLLEITSIIKQLIANNNDKVTLLSVASLGRSLVYWSPNLRDCFGPTSEQENEKWPKVKTALLECSYLAMAGYFDRTISELTSHFGKKLTNCSPSQMVEDCLIWEEVTLTEASEEGKSVSSVIRIPLQMSLPLNELLCNLSKQVNIVSAHSLPKPVSAELWLNLTRKVNEIYEEVYRLLTKSTFSRAIRQTRALQLYFDVLYFKQALASTRDERLKREAMASLQEVASLYESLIDPFDLHVFLPHLQTNLTKAARGSSLLFGLLSSELSSAPSKSKVAPSPQQTETHNLMCVYNYGALLPLVSMNGTTSKTEFVGKRKGQLSSWSTLK